MSSNFTLYYSLNQSTAPYNPCSSETIFVTDPEDIETFRGITNRYMRDSTYNNFTTDILTYISIRTKAKQPDFPKPMYNETFTITSQPYNMNFVQAVANYIDEGSGEATEIPFTNFTITGASGKFVGYKNIKVTYNNNDPRKTRTMEFS